MAGGLSKSDSHGDLPTALTTNEDSDLDSDTKVFRAKCALGVSVFDYSCGGKLYLASNLHEDKWVPKKLVGPVAAKPPAKRANPFERIGPKVSGAEW